MYNRTKVCAGSIDQGTDGTNLRLYMANDSTVDVAEQLYMLNIPTSMCAATSVVQQASALCISLVIFGCVRATWIRLDGRLVAAQII